MEIKDRNLVIILFILSFLLTGYRWPLKEKRGLTSSFAEWRMGHLHAGIDLPTVKIGEEVYAVSDGWIMRMRTSPWGYGKALYLQDSLENIYVYGHLSSFSGELDRIVRKDQLKRLSYETDVWFKRGEISIMEGEVIGYTGRSGCLAPHLHFEMRDPGNRPIDPLIRGFSFPDSIPPVISALRFLPLDDTSSVNGWHQGVILRAGQDTPFVFIDGRIGLEVEIYDKVNGHSGKLGPKEIELYISGRLRRREYYDRFSYKWTTDSRYEFDFANRVRTNRKFRRLFTVEGNDLPFYHGGNGILTSQDTGLVSILVRDAFGNQTGANILVVDSSACKVSRFKKQWDNVERTMTFANGLLVRQGDNSRWIGSSRIKRIGRVGDTMLVWNIERSKCPSYRSLDARCSIHPKEDAILNTSLISVRVNKGDSLKWIWEPPLPLNRKTTLKITVPSDPSSYSIYELVKGEWEYCYTKLKVDTLMTTINHLGTFTILLDTSPPVVELKRGYFNPKRSLEIYVRDSLSGVDFYSIKTFIDERPTVFRYDLQKERLIFEYPEEIIPGKYILRIFLKDRQGNKASVEWEITRGN
ncbi:M23 family metallopeptidase [candidate division WOR-3 bacterium]|nr:M23 family metallopeptidase [candidate division WOR-3 bacterium]